jgi:hypothetical protein
MGLSPSRPTPPPFGKRLQACRTLPRSRNPIQPARIPVSDARTPFPWVAHPICRFRILLTVSIRYAGERRLKAKPLHPSETASPSDTRVKFPLLSTPHLFPSLLVGAVSRSFNRPNNCHAHRRLDRSSPGQKSRRGPRAIRRAGESIDSPHNRPRSEGTGPQFASPK